MASACAETGICAKRPAETPGYDPKCGCDKVTYWNENVAGAHGANIAAAGPCAGEKVTKCSALKACPGDTSCNYDQGTKNQCNAIDPTGTCWQLPDDCPDLDGGRTKRCFGGDPAACAPLCNAIKQERTFYKVTNCQ